MTVSQILKSLSRILPLALAFNGSCQDSTGSGTSPVRERWYQPQGGYGRARPAILGSTVYFGTGVGQVIAREVTTGAIRWKAQIGNDAIQGANLVARDDVVVAPVLFYTVGLDATTGRELWRYAAPDDTTDLAAGTTPTPGSLVDSRIDADSQAVYIPAWGASVSAIDLHSGAVRWVWHPGVIDGDTATSGVFRSGSMGARVSGDTVFASLWHDLNRAGVVSEGWVFAIDRTTGSEIWRIRLPDRGSGALFESAPVIYKNLVIVHTLGARTYAIDRSTQQVVWQFTAQGLLHSTLAGPALWGDTVYVDGGDQRIYALDARTGTIIWSFLFDAQTSRDMLVTERRVIFTQGNLIYILDRPSGRLIASASQPRTTDPLIASPAAFANGLVFVTVADAAWCFEEP